MLRLRLDAGIRLRGPISRLKHLTKTAIMAVAGRLLAVVT